MKLGTRWAKYVGTVALAVLPFALLVVLPEGISRALLGEDSVVQWAGALSWLAASGLFAAVIWQRRRAGTLTVLSAFWTVGLVLMCLVAAGEEISWGQRLLGYDTPEVIGRTNLQGEMNLHNLEILDVRESVDGEKKSGLARWLTFNRLGSLLWMGYLILLPLMVQFVSWVRTLASRWGPPVPPLAVAVAAAVNYLTFSALMASLTTPETDQKLLNVGANEIKESAIAFLFAWAAYTGFQQIRSSSEPKRAAQPEPSLTG